MQNLNMLWPFIIPGIIHRELIYQTLLVVLMSVVSGVSERRKIFHPTLLVLQNTTLLKFLLHLPPSKEKSPP